MWEDIAIAMSQFSSFNISPTIDREMQFVSLIQLFSDQQSRRPIRITFPANFGGCVYWVGCSEAGKVNVKTCHWEANLITHTKELRYQHNKEQSGEFVSFTQTNTYFWTLNYRINWHCILYNFSLNSFLWPTKIPKFLYPPYGCC